MRRPTIAGIVLLTMALAAPARAQFGPENAAMGVLDGFMNAFNARDDEAMCRTFHYPHVRFASGAVRTYETYEHCVEQFDFVAESLVVLDLHLQFVELPRLGGD